MLAALAVPLLVFTVWMAVDALAAVRCHRNDHVGNGSDYCEDATLFAAIGVVYGTIALVVGGSMITIAARLFLRPGVRGRVMLLIGSAIVGSPIVIFLAVQLIWLR